MVNDIREARRLVRIDLAQFTSGESLLKESETISVLRDHVGLNLCDSRARRGKVT